MNIRKLTNKQEFFTIMGVCSHCGEELEVMKNDTYICWECETLYKIGPIDLDDFRDTVYLNDRRTYITNDKITETLKEK